MDCGGVHSHYFAHECLPVLAPLTEKTVCPPSDGFCKFGEGLMVHQHKDCLELSSSPAELCVLMPGLHCFNSCPIGRILESGNVSHLTLFVGFRLDFRGPLCF